MNSSTWYACKNKERGSLICVDKSATVFMHLKTAISYLKKTPKTFPHNFPLIVSKIHPLNLVPLHFQIKSGILPSCFPSFLRCSNLHPLKTKSSIYTLHH